MAEWFEAEQLVDDPGRRFNVAPTDPVSIVVEKDDRRAITAYRWGLVPFWAKDKSIGSRMINARAETLATNNAFRDSFEHRRCLVPADGFYEWRRGPKPRMPLWFHRADGRLLLMAGLYQDVSAAAGASEGPVRRFVVLTTTANDVVAPVHDRMPAILMPDQVDAWLAAPAPALLQPAPAGVLVATPVSDRVNSVKNDDPGCLAPPEAEGGGDNKGKQLRLFDPI